MHITSAEDDQVSIHPLILRYRPCRFISGHVLCIDFVHMGRRKQHVLFLAASRSQQAYTTALFFSIDRLGRKIEAMSAGVELVCYQNDWGWLQVYSRCFWCSVIF